MSDRSGGGAAPLKLAVVLGTRPEAVKLAPVVLAARAQPERFAVEVISTGQHREMLRSMLEWFGIEPDVSLEIMRPNQELVHITTAALEGVHARLKLSQPDWVLVQGDTATTFAAALAAFYQQIPVAHVEAGLRTHERYSPFPEEANRVMTTHLSTLHFAPTPRAKANLLREGIAEADVGVTGNTGIDALLWTRDKLEASGALDAARAPAAGRRQLLVTAHRRENHGEPMRGLCRALLRLLEAFADVEVVFPVHLSPKVREVVMPMLGEHPRVRLMEPLDYPAFVAAMARAHLILTDSGGVQEEAPSLAKPVLVLRESTERPEAIEAGTAMLVGAQEERIVQAASLLLSDAARYEAMARTANPYGDGRATQRILDAIAQHGRAKLGLGG